MRDNKGRFIKVNTQVPVLDKYKTIKKKSEQLVNHIAIVLDRSSSMAGISNEVINQFNKQVESIKENAKKTGQETNVSFWTFSTKVDVASIFEQPSEKLQPLSNYYPNGMTALFDGVGTAINRLSELPVANNLNHSFLVIVITDGEENQSTSFTAQRLKERIQGVTATDRWSFAFLTPSSGKKTLLNFGIPEGNIQVWEATSYGTRVATQQLLGATQSYYTARASGVTSTKSFFVPDLSNVSAAKMQRKLEDASKDFLRLNVTETGRIDDFVHKTTGSGYIVGSGYYQLTKSEKVQDYKGIVIREKSSNKLFAGRSGQDLQEVRKMLNLPPVGSTIQLHKASSLDYDIFIKSTSNNRKLIAGTTLLLDKTLI